MKKIISLVCSSLLAASAFGEYAVPLRTPLLLSANFTEFRANHFHSGIDLKTGGAVNLPVYSIEQGYVSRIFVSPSGYGLAIYIDHPDGRTSVYGHLSRFTSSIQEYVRKKQYEQESYKVDIQVPKGSIQIKKGELIAYSGNSGSSGGPHLHFEIRDTRTEFLINPLLFYKDEIKDARSPEFQALMIYPTATSSVINNTSSPVRITIPKDRAGNPIQFAREVNVWGKIGIGIKACDRMNGTSNSYGVTYVKLEMDGKEIFNYVNTSYSFLVGRMYNSVIDYQTWREKNEFFLRSFVEPGNTFPFYKTENNGYIQIDQERDYHFCYTIQDLHGNQSKYSFTLKGKKQDAPERKKSPYLFAWNKDNEFSNNSVSLSIPKGNIYNSFYFTLLENQSATYLSNVFRVNNFYVPLHSYCDLRIKVEKDTFANKSQYGIMQLSRNSRSWVGGKYENGFVKAGIRDLGDEFAVSYDNKPPVISPLSPNLWVKRGTIRISVADNLSGIQLAKGTIDGKFALFENDVKSAVYSYRIDGERIGKNRQHELHFVAKDACGNTSEYSYSFFF